MGAEMSHEQITNCVNPGNISCSAENGLVSITIVTETTVARIVMTPIDALQFGRSLLITTTAMLDKEQPQAPEGARVH